MNHHFLNHFALFCFALLSFGVTPRMYGTNLGGWFLLERFLNPSILVVEDKPEIQDEWTYCEVYQNDTEKLQVIRDHWDTWVTKEEIKLMSDIGFTTLRIPIGYWAMYEEDELRAAGDPYISGQWPYMVRVLGWMKEYGMEAIIDMHGAPGSQNGWDNRCVSLFSLLMCSGRTGEARWGEGDTIERTLDAIGRFASSIKDLEDDEAVSGVVIGLNVINEPFPPALSGGILFLSVTHQIGLDVAKDYYIRAYPVVREYLPADKYAYIIDHAFSNTEWVGFMNESQYENVWLDVHVYHVFEPGLRSLSMQQHLDMACEVDGQNVLRQSLPTIVGEWSIAYKVESDYAAGEPYPILNEQEFLFEFAVSQMKVYHNFFFWNFKTENAPMWDYLMGYRGGWLPQRFPEPAIDEVCPNFNHWPSQELFDDEDDEVEAEDEIPLEETEREREAVEPNEFSAANSLISFTVSLSTGFVGFFVLRSLY